VSADGGAGEATGPGEGAGEPSEDELRAAYEAELSRITATDMMAQAAVSLLNIGARRLQGSEQDPTGASERDLEQARDAIDAVRALLDILERRIPRELAPLRDALSRLQMAYARQAGEGVGGATRPSRTDRVDRDETGEQAPGAGEEGADGKPSAAPDEAAAGRQEGPGPAEASGRLWVPGR
jgi:Domain of unknown function (DUF1844)